MERGKKGRQLKLTNVPRILPLRARPPPQHNVRRRLAKGTTEPSKPSPMSYVYELKLEYKLRVAS